MMGSEDTMAQLRERLHHQNKDRLIDRLANRADLLVREAVDHARTIHSHEPLRYNLTVIDYLSQRLSLAEYCLRRNLGYAFYRRLAGEL